MDDQDKLPPDRSSRQGRSGQAGRQVARLLGAILDPAARRRGFAEASLLAILLEGGVAGGVEGLTGAVEADGLADAISRWIIG